MLGESEQVVRILTLRFSVPRGGLDFDWFMKKDGSAYVRKFSIFYRDEGFNANQVKFHSISDF